MVELVFDTGRPPFLVITVLGDLDAHDHRHLAAAIADAVDIDVRIVVVDFTAAGLARLPDAGALVLAARTLASQCRQLRVVVGDNRIAGKLVEAIRPTSIQCYPTLENALTLPQD